MPSRSAVAKQHHFNFLPEDRLLRTSRTRLVLEHRDDHECKLSLADVYEDSELALFHHDALDDSLSLHRASCYGVGLPPLIDGERRAWLAPLGVR